MPAIRLSTVLYSTNIKGLRDNNYWGQGIVDAPLEWSYEGMAMPNSYVYSE